MNDNQVNLLEILDYIDPSMLDYQEWCNIGMALKHEGFTASDWDRWSQRDGSRYHAGDCFKKWASFQGSASPVTAGTIVSLAKDHGWSPPRDTGYALEWDDIIGSHKDDLVIVKQGWVEGKEVTEPETWDGVTHLVKYLETLFEASENVGYVTDSWEKDGKFLPSKGCFDRTAGELIQQLNKCKGDIGAVLGDYKPEVGAWIRFNPLDGKGVKNENVTEFRYSLVESDTMDIDQQNAIIRELELPVACLVHSGKKSLHAIVRIDAANYDEYRKRVDYLYNVCQKNGLKIDSQNRNPSRLSRMPGVMRGEHKQFLVDTNIGKESWHEWQEWIEGINDELPEPESISDVWDNLPELSPPLIDGILRQGHKMLLAGPSKAGKSFLLIELCCAIAEGKQWLNWQCTKGKVLYVNLELDRASGLHRFKDVYNALMWKAQNLGNIDIWNLRGKAVPMDKLAPKLIRRAQKKNYIAIIIDPIYKVITGDENSADQMAHFCNQFDRVCTELGCAVIYCHHHSKGGQGAKKSMDRASGSGVFARDPDVLIDLIELDVSDKLLKQQEDRAVCEAAVNFLSDRITAWDEDISEDDALSERFMMESCKRLLDDSQYQEFLQIVRETKANIGQRSAWRIEGTLREFPKFAPVNLWFDYPVHNIDTVGVLKDADADGEKAPWQKKQKSPEQVKKEKKETFEMFIQSCNFGEPPTVKVLATSMGVSEKTVRRYVRENPNYEIIQNEVRDKRDK